LNKLFFEISFFHLNVQRHELTQSLNSCIITLHNFNIGLFWVDYLCFVNFELKSQYILSYLYLSSLYPRTVILTKMKTVY